MQLCAILFQCSPNHILTVKLNFHRLIVIQINHADKSIHTFLGQTSYVCFLTCLLFYLRYSHNALRFTNHVGEQRNFCKQKCDVPLLVCLSNSTLSAQRSAYFFKTLYGTTFPHTAHLHKFMNNQTLPLRAGCRGRQPLQIFGIVYVAAKSLCSVWLCHSSLLT